MSFEFIVQELRIDFRCDEVRDGLEKEWDRRVLQRYISSAYRQYQG